MGRNLFCVHSKKHIDDVPELKAAKMETNRKTLVAMQRAFNTGVVLYCVRSLLVLGRHALLQLCQHCQCSPVGLCCTSCTPGVM
jgi:hypothetical protein